MQLPERFSALLGYPFVRLRALLSDIPPGIPPGAEPLLMSVGEPRHPFPPWLGEELVRHVSGFNSYPKNNGEPELIEAIAGYLDRRFGLKGMNSEHLTPLNGTREGLYMAALALLPEKKNGKTPKILVPNPFYQAYMMGARTLGLPLEFIGGASPSQYLPDYQGLEPALLDEAAAVFLCSPANPQGAIADEQYLRTLLELAEKHDFLVFSDECYSEIYYGSPPPSALAVAQKIGVDLNRVIIFHSLSKRSNAPGLRSGFAATGQKSMAQFQKLRGYVGAPVPGPIQKVSARAWSEDAHVEESRLLYQQKMQLAGEILSDDARAEGGFCLWLNVGDGEQFAKALWRDQGVEVLPGQYLGAKSAGGNPGAEFIRVALVDEYARVEDGLRRIADQKVKFSNGEI